MPCHETWPVRSTAATRAARRAFAALIPTELTPEAVADLVAAAPAHGIEIVEIDGEARLRAGNIGVGAARVEDVLAAWRSAPLGTQP